MASGLAGDRAKRLVAEERFRRPSLEDVLDELGRPLRSALAGTAPTLVGRSSSREAGERALALFESGECSSFVIAGLPGSGRTRLLEELKWGAQTRMPVAEVRTLEGAWAPLEALVDHRLPSGLEGLWIAAEGAAVEGRSDKVVLVCDDVDPNVARSAVRALPNASAIFLLLTTTDASAADVFLSPLKEEDLAAWVPSWSARERSRLFDVSRGFPSEVEAAVASVVSGHRTPSDLRPGPSLRPIPEDPELQRALASLAAGRADAESWRLQSMGWAIDGPDGLRLRREADAVRIAEALPAETRAAHEACLATATGSARARHLAGSGSAAEAVALASSATMELDPEGWRRALGSWAPVHLRARALRVAGRPDLALQLLATDSSWLGDSDSASASDSDSASDFEGRLEVALAYLGVGDGRRAERHARRAKGAAAADAQARALLRQGKNKEARELAEAARFEATGDDAARLAERIGVADIYLGDVASARDHLAQAEGRTLSTREEVRLRSYQGIAAFREGDIHSARDAYRRARELAEDAGLSDLLATAALNEGTAAQQLGDWGAALSGYRRALRLAIALKRDSTERTLRYNLANLRLAIGDVAGCVEQLSGIEGGGLGVRLGASLLRAELAQLGEGDVNDALAEATALADESGQPREALEAMLIRAEHEDVSLAAAESLEARAANLETVDLQIRAALLRAGHFRRAGEMGASLRAAEEALANAERVSEQALVARCTHACSQAAEGGGAQDLAEHYRRRCRELWERIALSLPAALREVFWRHPERMGVQPSSRPIGVAGDVLRLLELNKRINSSLSTPRILEHALDAGIELSGAERGFVLLRSQDASLQVAAARNVDRDHVDATPMKFSRSIAEEVLQGGRPIITRDARTDARFSGQHSVHAMRLTSVVCVPIESPTGRLGALYLDHRFASGRFNERAVEVLQALADQVAIALDNAALNETLAARTRDLEQEKRRVEHLLREREDELAQRVAEIAALRQAQGKHDYHPLVGQSAAMRTLFALLDRVVESSLSVLILGESGTGKELVARALHRLGPRRDRPLMTVNCAALPETLLESELFGHRRGAFTGADRDREGLLVSAQGGTVFLDEVGEMPPPMQAKLLRVLQEREVRPLGGTEALSIDFRLLAATNRDLRAMVKEGRFREDLFYRLSVVEVRVPPLRERRSDLPLLADAILERVARDQGQVPAKLSADALRALQRHGWPGNVRELENVLARALVLYSGEAIQAGDLSLRGETGAKVARPRDRAAFEKDEAKRIAAVLEATGWNVSETARQLGIPRNTLYRRMKRYGLHR
ncbi:MAG: sigma 54-interacting transcriptional regulator [Myxococcota bacterium]